MKIKPSKINGYRGFLLVVLKTGNCQRNCQRKSKKPLQFAELQGFLILIGGPDGTRTRDPLRDRQVF